MKFSSIRIVVEEVLWWLPLFIEMNNANLEVINKVGTYRLDLS